MLRPVRLTHKLYLTLRELAEAGESVDWTFAGMDPASEPRPYPMFTVLTADPDWLMRWARSEGAEVSELRDEFIEDRGR